MTREQLKADVPAYWLGMAEEALRAGELSLKNGMLVSAVNRMYYAAFYCACCILARMNTGYGKHSAVRAALHRDVIKPGKLPIEFGQMYDELFQLRNRGDYALFCEFSTEQIESLMVLLKKFVDSVRCAGI
jgi:uncharacterized protein (UPF0332 family)